MRVLVVNAGSSTVKLRLLDHDDRLLADRELAAPRSVVDPVELRDALDAGMISADAVGHRVVHGGDRFVEAVRIDGSVRTSLEQLTALAPLHQRKALAAIDAVSRALPGPPAIACFDTAFHATLSPAASTYAVPSSWRERWGIRRYGFHGLSHAWVAQRAAELVGRPADSLRIVSCHLGAGASLCAIAGGASVDTTMGFTPLEGLVMATRSGTVDPGMLLWLLERGALTERELAEGLEHQSGLLGLATSADMREILDREQANDPDAGLALDVYVHRLVGLIGSMVAVLGGVDVLAFTGGVGENSAPIRARVADRLRFLGVRIDERANAAPGGDADISEREATVRTLVVHAREDLEIARQVRAVLEE